MDDSAFAFHSKEEMARGAQYLQRKFDEFGLEMHVGRNGDESKTEFMVFPGKTQTISEDDKEQITLEDGSYITYTDKFKYLGSIVTPDLKSDTDVHARIRLAGYAFHRLRPLLRNNLVRRNTKVKIYRTFVHSTLLYGCESWTLSAKLLHDLKSFHHRCIRRIAGYNGFDQHECHITHTQTLTALGLADIESTINHRILSFLNKAVNLPPTAPGNQILNSWPASGFRPDGGTRHTLRNTRVAALRSVYPNMTSNGSFSDDFHRDMLKDDGAFFKQKINHLKRMPPPSPPKPIDKRRPVHKMHPIQLQVLELNPQYPNLADNKNRLERGEPIAPVDMPSIEEWRASKARKGKASKARKSKRLPAFPALCPPPSPPPPRCPTLASNRSDQHTIIVFTTNPPPQLTHHARKTA